MTLRTIMFVCAGALGLAGAGARAQSPACAGTPSSTQLQIATDNLKSAKGQVTGTLYPGDKSKFLVGGGSLLVWRAPAVAPETDLCVYLPGPGAYAVVVYQDLNMNGKWDHNILGTVEPVGFSNNPSLGLKAPSYESVKFDAGEGVTTLRVRLHYYK